MTFLNPGFCVPMSALSELFATRCFGAFTELLRSEKSIDIAVYCTINPALISVTTSECKDS
jgi:hypothetical protein